MTFSRYMMPLAVLALALALALLRNVFLAGNIFQSIHGVKKNNFCGRPSGRHRVFALGNRRGVADPNNSHA